MNILELKMVDLLKDLKENHCVAGVKMEFEAEGTRMEEALRLKEITTKTGLDLTIKIGGCEALKDMYDARLIGASAVVGPMIESAYALKKFLACANRAFPEDERNTVKFMINIETITAYNNFPEMLAIPAIGELDGIVIGRGDMAGSMGLSQDEVNSDVIGNMCSRIISRAKENQNLECIIGGGVGADTVSFFDKYTANRLDKFETRKVIFDAARSVSAENRKAGILKALELELLWLKNKRNFYGMIYREDDSRIETLQQRYNSLARQAEGAGNEY